MSLRVIFCGTPEFALPSLRALWASEHPLVGVVTLPDRAQGRGQKLLPSPVKRAAESRGVPIWQPERLDAAEFLRSVAAVSPDLLLVVAFRILPESLYGLARLGAVNLHASLLPAYRGAAPIARALLDGCDRTGVSTFQIDRTVDTGGVLLQRAVSIAPDDNAETLSLRLAEIGAELVIETLDALAAGELAPQAQNHALATRAPKLTAEDRPIRWHEPARVSHNRVRALAPRPGATVRKNAKTWKVLATEFDSAPIDAHPGTVLAALPTTGIAVATGLGTLRLKTVQPESRPAMGADAFLRGHPIAPGERFE
jgi:methionyl-tRNA formyltransferase